MYRKMSHNIPARVNLTTGAGKDYNASPYPLQETQSTKLQMTRFDTIWSEVDTTHPKTRNSGDMYEARLPRGYVSPEFRQHTP